MFTFKTLADMGSISTASYRKSLVNSKTEKSQFKEFTIWSTPRGSKPLRVEKKLDIDLNTERRCTKDESECLLHTKKKVVLIDGWAHIACQGRKLSEKSNFAWYQEISQFQQRSHLWYVGKWALFYPLLPCLFLNRSLIDFQINDTQVRLQSGGLAFQSCEQQKSSSK